MPSLPNLAAWLLLLLLLAVSLPPSAAVPRATRTRVARHKPRPVVAPQQPVVAAAVTEPVPAAAAVDAAASTPPPPPPPPPPTPAPTTTPPPRYPPVLIVINTPHYFGTEFARANFTCTVPGVKEGSEPWNRFQCTFSEATGLAEKADALW